MKKVTSIFAAFMLLAALAPQAFAQFPHRFCATTDNDIELCYKVNDDGVSVTLYSSYPCEGTLVIPDSVTDNGTTYAVKIIDNNALYGRTGLTSITVPNSVDSIGVDAFYNVRYVVYHGSATGSPWGALSVNGFIDGDYIFSDSTKHYLQAYRGTEVSVTIPSTVDTIGPRIFYYNTSLTSVTMGDSVRSIGDEAFNRCFGLASVSFGSGLTTIGREAFAYCRGLTAIDIPNSVTSIGSEAFAYCSGLTAIAIPNSVISIDSAAFAYCNGLTAITIPNSVTSIGSEAFRYCNGLTAISIPNSVTTIGREAFAYCRGLTAISIPNSVTTIGRGAFAYCGGLTALSIPNSVTSIGKYAFIDCTGLTSIVVDDSNVVYDSRNNCNALIETATGNLIKGCSNTVIPDGVRTIEEYALKGCSGLRTVVIPNSVDSIGDYAFSGCSGLYFLTIGRNVSAIGRYAFNCVNIVEIHSLNSVPPTLYESVFYGVSNEIQVFVPCGSSDLYLSAWNRFRNFEEEMNFRIVAIPADERMGSTQVDALPTCLNPHAAIRATAREGYRFVRWSDGNTEADRSVPIVSDTTFIAYFESLEGIDIIDSGNINAYSIDGHIIVEGFEGATIQVFDIVGRPVDNRDLTPGVYIVKVGTLPAHKVAVTR
ncbi:MAG: leucine-rich repeat domain-containing protein [Bacteroidales bacterium]|nr:leucine-rich repeat domain-containing protein [Bacteroidales bacterium]